MFANYSFVLLFSVIYKIKNNIGFIQDHITSEQDIYIHCLQTNHNQT